ncbi:MAG: hypothetical protein ACE5FT_04785 [Candidatus Nanoarchaeia archaeon]
MNKKKRRHSGYVTPRLTIPKKVLIEEDLFVNPLYDEWEDYRDGFRDWFGDYKKIKRVHTGMIWYMDDLYEKRVRMNQKQKRLLKKRKARCKHILLY